MIDTSGSTDTIVILDALPDDSRVWIYGLDRDLSDDEVQRIGDGLESFFAEWSSHGRHVFGGAAIVDNRFVVIGAHIPSGDISGCGIDKSIRVLASLADDIGLGWDTSLNVFYQSPDGIRMAGRAEFRRAAAEGEVSGETPVYDLTPQTLGELRENGLVRMAADSWHGRAFHLT